jgi:hypothetical protein
VPVSDRERWPQGARFVIHRVWRGTGTSGRHAATIFDRAFCHRPVRSSGRRCSVAELERYCDELNAS